MGGPPGGSDGASMRLGAVVVDYRSWPQADRTVAAVLSGTRPPDWLVIVDNGSGDGSAEVIGETLPHLEVVEATANHGAGAVLAVFTAREAVLAERRSVRGWEQVCRPVADALDRVVGRGCVRRTST